MYVCVWGTVLWVIVWGIAMGSVGGGGGLLWVALHTGCQGKLQESSIFQTLLWLFLFDLQLFLLILFASVLKDYESVLSCVLETWVFWKSMVGRGSLTPPILWRPLPPSNIAYLPPFFKFYHLCPLSLSLSFCCLVSLTDYLIASDLMCYFA